VRSIQSLETILEIEVSLLLNKVRREV
jgi:hypothetical protein